MLSLAALATLALTASCASAKYWFSFGDSYTQTGFDITGPLPTERNPLGNPPYPGWTATGGENWVGYVTTKYNSSLLLTYNFAYGGATIDANLVRPFDPAIKTLTDQVNQFLGSVASKPANTPWTSQDALFSIFIGINDIGNTYYQSGDRDAFSDTLLNAEFALVERLYNVGARNFLFVNVPPVDRSPLMLGQSSDARAKEKQVLTGFNNKLRAKVISFQSSHSDVATYLWNSDATFTAILNNPTAYGFRDATSSGSGSNIFWGDVYHPSSFAHNYFGEAVAQLLRGEW